MEKTDAPVRRRAVPKRTVRAIPRDHRNLELLESVELPAGSIVSVTIDMPETEAGESTRAALPVRDMGAVLGSLSRDEIYGDRNG